MGNKFVGVLMAAATCCVVLTAPVGMAQSVAMDAKPTVGSPAAVVTLDVVRADLERVLRDIARQAGVKLYFSGRGLPQGHSVTMRVHSIPVGDAFARALAGTGLRAIIEQDMVMLQRVGHETVMGVQGDITGKVIDARTKQKLRGATVTVSGTTHRAMTDDNGSFRVAHLDPGTYTVQVRLLGYVKTSQTITVTDGQTSLIEVAMEPSVSALDQVIVTGTIVATAQREVPNAMTVITAKDLQARGITHIDQLFRGDIPGLFAQNQGTNSPVGQVIMYSRGATSLGYRTQIANDANYKTNPIKTYVDGVELADPSYLSQIDPQSIERIEVLTGPQASTIYGSNAINGVMQIFTKRGASATRPRVTVSLLSGLIQNNFSDAYTPQHDYTAQMTGTEGRWSYNMGGSWNYMGPWSPSMQTSRVSGFGGARFQIHQVTMDGSFRLATTRNRVRGSSIQTSSSMNASGLTAPAYYTGTSAPTQYTLNGRTVGATLGYAPTPWWSHQLVLGTDNSETGNQAQAPGYIGTSDTLLLLSQGANARTSIQYTTTARLPVTTHANIVVTGGADGWHTSASSTSIRATTLTGYLNGPNLSRWSGHNTGAFVQSQLGIADKVFVTYGLRAEWNPNYGAEAQPNFAPRYGIAYTQELGALTAKLRASYGRSTRPPLRGEQAGSFMTDADAIARYGFFFSTLPNVELNPEIQQGGEGGVEMYFGSRASLVVTRYNQTVDNLIVSPKVDSVRSLQPLDPNDYYYISKDAAGYGYYTQDQNLNLGSIRNQGWELQGTMNLGPLSARGTYSWTKSRVIGVSPKYRYYFTPDNYPEYQPGASFRYLPEHTWALGATYAHAATTVGLNVTGVSMLQSGINMLYLNNIAASIRLAANRLRMSTPNGYTYPNPGYAIADLNASHRFSSTLEGVLQIQNIGDFYRNDRQAQYAVIGRQSKIGVRVQF